MKTTCKTAIKSIRAAKEAMENGNSDQALGELETASILLYYLLGRAVMTDDAVQKLKATLVEEVAE